jgi:hypothetical protein
MFSGSSSLLELSYRSFILSMYSFNLLYWQYSVSASSQEKRRHGDPAGVNGRRMVNETSAATGGLR